MTLQLRYLVFHGPFGLIALVGGSVQVGNADGTTVINRAKKFGFSVRLRYSISRTAPFFPYWQGTTEGRWSNDHLTATEDGVGRVEKARRIYADSDWLHKTAQFTPGLILRMAAFLKQA